MFGKNKTSFKIGSSVGIIILLLGITVMFGVYQASKVSNEIIVISQEYAPLSEIISEIRFQNSNQEVDLEKIIRFSETNDVLEIEKAKEEFWSSGAIIVSNLERGKKIALVGKNGEGKTTMSRIIVGELEHQGSLKIGHNVDMAYFAQNQAEELDKEKTVFEIIDGAAHGEIRKKVRSLLGSFMFGEEEVSKKIKVLSGGERARVALCKLLLEPINLLILGCLLSTSEN